MQERDIKLGAIGLPLYLGALMNTMQPAHWAFWGQNPSKSSPLFWKGIDWLLQLFVLPGYLLDCLVVLPMFLIMGLLGLPLIYFMHPSLFSAYLFFRERSVSAGDLWRASCAGTITFIMYNLLWALHLKGSRDSWESVSVFMGQSNGLVVGVLAVELTFWLCRRRVAT